MINLNNPLNALADMPLVEELSDRKWRKQLANCMDEALTIMKALGIRPEISSPLPPSWVPTILRLPTVLFKVVASKMLRIDPLARSSMWEDIKQNRPTEIDHINGKIVKVSKTMGISTPHNSAVVERIKRLESRMSGRE